MRLVSYSQTGELLSAPLCLQTNITPKFKLQTETRRGKIKSSQFHLYVPLRGARSLLSSAPSKTSTCQHIENLVIKLAPIAPLGIKYSRVIKENILQVKFAV